MATGVPPLRGREGSREDGRDWDTRGSEKVTEGVLELEVREVMELSRVMLPEAEGGGASVSVSVVRSENAPGTRRAGRRGRPELADEGGRTGADTSVKGGLRAVGLRAVEDVAPDAGIW